MNKISRICIIGGGSQGHVVAACWASKGYNVSILTRQPQKWDQRIRVNAPDGVIEGTLTTVSANPEDVIPDADVVLLTVPGYANETELTAIAPHLKDGCFVGGVFCSSGFFFEALKHLPPHIKLWGFQRVPFIARVQEYGHSANLTGYRPQFRIAVERAPQDEKQAFAHWLTETLGSETYLLNNYLEASITNSNPILHTARLYTMFSQWGPGKFSPNNILFYKEWTVEAAELLIAMDKELFRILEKLPVAKGYLTPLLEYYESQDAESLRNKISSIPAFASITSPMIMKHEGWVPDYSSRYFTEDFGFSLRYIWELGHQHNVPIPNIDKVYNWGLGKIQNQG